MKSPSLLLMLLMLALFPSAAIAAQPDLQAYKNELVRRIHHVLMREEVTGAGEQNRMGIAAFCLHKNGLVLDTTVPISLVSAELSRRIADAIWLGAPYPLVDNGPSQYITGQARCSRS